MGNSRRLFFYLFLSGEEHASVLAGPIAHLARELAASAPDCRFSFIRSSEPEWLIRVLVQPPPGEALPLAGSAAVERGDWLELVARPALLTLLAPLGRHTIVTGEELPEFANEAARWGGATGLDLAEETAHLDCRAALQLLGQAAPGQAGLSLRETHLVMTEALLDLLGVSGSERLRVYERGWSWPVVQGLWTPVDIATIEERFQSMKEGLAALTIDALPEDAATVVASWDREFQPVAKRWVAARDSGALDADWTWIVWSLAHVQAMRLCIEGIPEAMLRYFMFRLNEPGKEEHDEQEPKERSEQNVSMTLSIPAPEEVHDAVILEAIGPLLGDLTELAELTAPGTGTAGATGRTFERYNKPEWRIGLTIEGSAIPSRETLDRVALRRLTPLIERGTIAGFSIGHETSGDKWLGGENVRRALLPFFSIDSMRVLDLMRIEAAGGLAGSRAEFSLRFVEHLLGLFELRGSQRLEFDRRGYQWAIDSGRWGHEVIASLESKFESQKEALAGFLDGIANGKDDSDWGDARTNALAARWIGEAREALAGAVATIGELEDADAVELAGFAVRAHSNRLGLGATQQAVGRWLLRQARLSQ